MIRPATPNDIPELVDIWFSASIKAHSFVDEKVWQSQVEAMRDIYLPNSETYVYEENAKTIAFYTLNDDQLAAIFVAIGSQGKGIGKQLIVHALKQRDSLSLSVYQENQASILFYLGQGFSIKSKQKDAFTGHLEYTMMKSSE
ncbi:MAG: GNAT family N-acetyltransferase [Marinomonas sp.]